MCMIDDSDGSVNVLREKIVLAKKEHKCKECYRQIAVGERYLSEACVFDGDFYQHKTCQHCQVARNWLISECRGFVYGRIRPDISEHATGYGMKVARMYVAMKNKWTTRKGTLMPIERFQNAELD